MAVRVLRDPAPRVVVATSPKDVEVVTTAPPSKIGPEGPPGPPAWLPPVGWVRAMEYYVGPPASTVIWQGSSYLAIADSIGLDPDKHPEAWVLLAAGGAESTRLNFTQSFAIADTVWTVEHNLGFTPGGIQVYDQFGANRFGFRVTSNTAESTTVEFAFPLIGRIVLS